MRSEHDEQLPNERRRPGGKIALARWIAFLVAAFVVQHAAAQASRSAAGEIRTILVASFGDGPSAVAMRARVIDRLKKHSQLKIVEDAASADAVLSGTSSIWATGTISFSPHSNAANQTVYQGYLSVELVGKANQTLWSYMVTPSRFSTAGITNDLADQIVSHLLTALATGAAGSGSPVVPSPKGHVALHAAGATLPAPLYLKWIQSSGMAITYDAVGSEAGIEQLGEGKVDFAASDMPLGTGNAPLGLQVTHFPTVVGAVVPIYNLPTAGRTLRLTAQILAGIYSGAIRKWNDPRIAEANRGVRLPDADISVVHRADGSGTTFVWTSYLSLASAEWKNSVGAGTHVTWPTGAGAAGNEGVAELVQKTPNSIGYVELIYAIQHELSYAAVRNPAGEFIKADLASITAAAAGAHATEAKEFRSSILDSPNKYAYPISTFTWLLVPKTGVSAEKRAAIADWLNWAMGPGQKECASLGYAPLPREIVNSEIEAVGAWKNRGQ